MSRIHESFRRTRGMVQFVGLLALISASASLVVGGIVIGIVTP